MTDNKKDMRDTYTIYDDQTIGKVQIADEVVAIIAGLAATEVEGVASMAGNITNELVGKLGMKNLSKGVKVDVLENVVCVNLNLNLEYGYSIPETHDTCDTDGFFSITDHQDIFIHLTFLSVQSNKFFVFSGTAYMDLMVCDRIQIIGMHRLTIFFHDIVCDIYQVVDRADTVGCQTSLHPFR